MINKEGRCLINKIVRKIQDRKNTLRMSSIVVTLHLTDDFSVYTQFQLGLQYI